MIKCAIVMVACLAASSFGVPINQHPYDPSSDEYGNEIEGDMIEPFPGAFSGLLSSSNRWPNRVVVYKFDSSLSSTLRSRAQEAMKRITQETGGCIKFRAASSSDGSKYVLLQSRDSGCSATVGYWGRTTNMKLGSSCSANTIMHEFQHTLGVYHQQSRPDRDKYVKIRLENVKSGHEHNFSKRSSSQVGTYGVSYDFSSQMHYSEYAFSKNGQKTIVPIPSGVSIGKRDRMSKGDIALIKAMYKC